MLNPTPSTNFVLDPFELDPRFLKNSQYVFGRAKNQKAPKRVVLRLFYVSASDYVTRRGIEPFIDYQLVTHPLINTVLQNVLIFDFSYLIIAMKNLA
jgi:hypothetical protein